MVSFYKDKEKRILNPTLFSDVAMDWAEKIHNSGRGKANKRSQLRKFFDEVIRLNSRSKTEDWDNILPYVNMLIAKAAYAEGRHNVTPDFVNLMKSCIREVHEKKDLAVFANFFEAFMGFYRKYGEN
ncbi:MAG: type III-A CRISPR-associated protein Csm2 [Thermodesulfobacteriota bacterium]|nr:type III-A CRISPR-associated protein Csm2 [Thermodesulfobacteriota bacterium]